MLKYFLMTPIVLAAFSASAEGYLSDKEISISNLNKIFNYSVRLIESQGSLKELGGCIAEARTGNQEAVLSLYVISRSKSVIDKYQSESVSILSNSKFKEDAISKSRERSKNTNITEMKLLVRHLPRANKVCNQYVGK